MKVKIGSMFGIEYILEDKKVKESKYKCKRIKKFYDRCNLAAEKLLEDEKFFSYYKI